MVTAKLMTIASHIPFNPSAECCDKKSASGIRIRQSEIKDITIVVIVLPVPLIIPFDT